MSQLTQTKCDSCGALKKDTNHWFKFRYDPSVKQFTIGFDNSCPYDACSSDCLLKAVSNFINEVTKQ
jgi:hypothetical protein